MPEISLKPEELFNLGTLQVTNTLLTTVLVYLFLTIFLLIFSATFKPLKPSKLQLAFEMLVEMLGGVFKDIAGHTYNFSKLFSFVFSFFIFILISNWFGLLPFVGPLVVNHTSESVISETPNFVSCLKNRNCIYDFKHGVLVSEHVTPLFRAPTSDLSVTLALALLSVLVTNALGVASQGFGYFK